MFRTQNYNYTCISYVQSEVETAVETWSYYVTVNGLHDLSFLYASLLDVEGVRDKANREAGGFRRLNEGLGGRMAGMAVRGKRLAGRVDGGWQRKGRGSQGEEMDWQK